MSYKVKTWFLFFSALLLVLLVAAVSFFKVQSDMKNVIREDLLGDHPSCSLPCWNNITPGITTREEAIKIIRETAYIDQDSVKITGSVDFGGCLWRWKVFRRGMLPGLGWQDGVVSEITLDLAFDLSIGEVITRFGPPEAVRVSKGGGEVWNWVINMFYPQAGIQLRIFTPNFSNLIEPSTKVGDFVLYAPSSLEHRLAEVYSNYDVDRINRLYTSWKGYGDIRELYDFDWRGLR
jgi:hypothetical protein